MPIERLRYVGLSHVEADECGCLESAARRWRRGRAAVQPDRRRWCRSTTWPSGRPARWPTASSLALGRHTLQWFDTPHVPHGWDCGLLMDADHRHLLLRRPVHPAGPRRAGPDRGRHPRPERGLPPADGLLRACAAHGAQRCASGTAGSAHPGLHARQRLARRWRRAAAPLGRIAVRRPLTGARQQGVGVMRPCLAATRTHLTTSQISRRKAAIDPSGVVGCPRQAFCSYESPVRSSATPVAVAPPSVNERDSMATRRSLFQTTAAASPSAGGLRFCQVEGSPT